MRRNKARRFKKVVIRAISKANTRARETYGYYHIGHTVENFWQFIHFIDEAHMDPNQMHQEFVL